MRDALAFFSFSFFIFNTGGWREASKHNILLQQTHYAGRDRMGNLFFLRTCVESENQKWKNDFSLLFFVLWCSPIRYYDFWILCFFFQSYIIIIHACNIAASYGILFLIFNGYTSMNNRRSFVIANCDAVINILTRQTSSGFYWNLFKSRN